MALAYVIFGLIIAVLGGMLIEKLGMEQYVQEYIRKASANEKSDTLDTEGSISLHPDWSGSWSLHTQLDTGALD